MKRFDASVFLQQKEDWRHRTFIVQERVIPVHYTIMAEICDLAPFRLDLPSMLSGHTISEIDDIPVPKETFFTLEQAWSASAVLAGMRVDGLTTCRTLWFMIPDPVFRQKAEDRFCKCFLSLHRFATFSELTPSTFPSFFTPHDISCQNKLFWKSVILATKLPYFFVHQRKDACSFVSDYYFEHGFQGSSIGLHKALMSPHETDKNWYLHISVTRAFPEASRNRITGICGHDRRLVNLVTSCRNDGTAIYQGWERIRFIKERYARTRASFQKKGAKGAKKV